ncbi:hypothetical protein FJR11_06335 [Anabaena sp. UHCC 0187]|uniref:hypothetical protein n=1 Tax=Anabaena sp. UHCC 0187 TaxID=2590018 RepID=UPI0014474A80|nr:hypothetical protein [Anabaena sp. UHCC 0187]MTJ12219.1 hypothetical protein [Anabaena sp. UHCC 0187]
MAEKSLVEILGTGATRLASAAAAPSAGLFIPDSLLISAGLTTPTTATAEGHIVAIVKLLKTNLTQTAYDLDNDNSVYLSDGFPGFTTRGTTQYRIDQIVFNLAKVDSESTLDPTKY